MVQSIDDARRRQRSGGRVPPHNLEAEESLLGAMLLSGDAIASAVNIHLSADDFYKPAHGHIYDAICTLYAQGEPVDPVTVEEGLRRADLQDMIGGLPALLSLEARTPATSNAARYARIVEDHALLRRLIGVAGEIAELGYDLPNDVAMAVDRAEAMVYEVAQRRVTDSLVDIRALLEQSLDHIEALYERGETITGVPTGYTDLDELLAGLQPSNLVIVGARPAAGKALALDTSIPTPDGWTTMADITVGSEVFDEQGRPCRVTYVSPVFVDHDCYEVRFDDGSRLVADAEHQWFAYDFPAWKSHRALSDRLAHGPCAHPTLARDQSARKRHPRVLTTEQMHNEGVRHAREERPNWYLPLAAALDCPDGDLPVDPYVLGCWLGDGSSSAALMWLGEEDAPHFLAEFTAAGYPLVPRPGRGPLCYAVTPVAGTGRWQGYRGPLRVLARELQQVGLLGGAEKHIPAAYMRSSAKQRLALLQGLLDTDGTVNKNTGTVTLCLANWRLLDQARELACSLGHKAGSVREKKIRLPDGRYAVAWHFAWTPLDPVFRLPRKAELLARRRSGRRNGKYTRRVVTEIRRVDSVPTRCIAVDSPSHLYLAGESLIPSHNTSMALGMEAHAALHANKSVLIFSLEMSHLELTQRLLCAEARVDAGRLRTGRLQEPDWPKISHAVGRLGEANIFIDDNPHLTVMEIRAKARRLKSRHGELGLIVVDYLQLMAGRPDAENRQVEVSEISRGLKILARELECPVVALSQLSRGLETRADKRPMLADLRESGSLEQDADVVLFIYRDEIYNPESADRGTAEIIVAKHRNGPTGSVHLAFVDRYTLFANMAKGV
jgi:replicative DNA helicase